MRLVPLFAAALGAVSVAGSPVPQQRADAGPVATSASSLPLPTERLPADRGRPVLNKPDTVTPGRINGPRRKTPSETKSKKPSEVKPSRNQNKNSPGAGYSGSTFPVGSSYKEDGMNLAVSNWAQGPQGQALAKNAKRLGASMLRSGLVLGTLGLSEINRDGEKVSEAIVEGRPGVIVDGVRSRINKVREGVGKFYRNHAGGQSRTGNPHRKRDVLETRGSPSGLSPQDRIAQAARNYVTATQQAAKSRLARARQAIAYYRQNPARLVSDGSKSALRGSMFVASKGLSEVPGLNGNTIGGTGTDMVTNGVGSLLGG